MRLWSFYCDIYFYICVMIGTKEKIIDAAVSCLNTNPSATIEEIANHIGITRRTIHRHFPDRTKLIEYCRDKMMKICNAVMTKAYQSSQDPLEQIENMFYAALSVGAEYSFVKKLYARSAYKEVIEKQAAVSVFDNVKEKWFALITELQQQNVIPSKLPIAWIYDLFGGMIDIAVAAQSSGDVAVNEVKSLSWNAFKASIGINNE